MRHGRYKTELSRSTAKPTSRFLSRAKRPGLSSWGGSSPAYTESAHDAAIMRPIANTAAL